MDNFKALLVKVIENVELDEGDVLKFSQIRLEDDETNRSRYYIKFYGYLTYKITQNEADLVNFFKMIGKETCFEEESSGLKERGKRIEIKRAILNFRVIDWDDDEMLNQLEEYFYKRGLFDYEGIQREKSIQKIGRKEERNVPGEARPIQVTQVGGNPFKMRNVQTMTLDEYVEYVTRTNAETIQKAKNRAQVRQTERDLYFREEEKKDEKRDEADEDYRSFRGNLYKQG
ncbi:hypothetical protein ECANGB1_2234 [Enterospora canceri]|uniref:Uncharacterized protein n=1 Tax=Enterospora canceri TaxID=1081671 RepID=A0A1Y1S9G2_9MICR|nr:hypothetical protein ECANGB1_2234 [Enterospora canceri]